MSRRSKWVFGGFAAIALFLLAMEHRAHVLPWLPWLILLVCLFMHRGHGHGEGGEKSDSGDDK